MPKTATIPAPMARIGPLADQNVCEIPDEDEDEDEEATQAAVAATATAAAAPKMRRSVPGLCYGFQSGILGLSKNTCHTYRQNSEGSKVDCSKSSCKSNSSKNSAISTLPSCRNGRLIKYGLSCDGGITDSLRHRFEDCQALPSLLDLLVLSLDQNVPLDNANGEALSI